MKESRDMATKKSSTATTAGSKSRTKTEELRPQKRNRKPLVKLNDNHRWVICFILVFVSAFMVVSIVSHYFTWQADQTGDVVSNSGGSLGLAIARLLVGRWFGVFALCVPLAGFVLAFAVRKAENNQLGKVVKVLLLLMLLGSMSLGFIFGTSHNAFGSGFGGGIGIVMSDWLSEIIGRTGEALLLCMCWILLALYINSARTIQAFNTLFGKIAALFKKRPAESGDERDLVLAPLAVENDDVAAEQQEEDDDDFEVIAPADEKQEEEQFEEELPAEEEQIEEDDNLVIILPAEEESIEGEHTEQEEPIEQEESIEQVEQKPEEDDDFVDVPIGGAAVAAAGAKATTSVTFATGSQEDLDDDFEIVSNTVPGMQGLPVEGEDAVLGTGGIVETDEEGNVRVVQSEHTEEEGRIGTFYDPTKELAKFQRPPLEILEKCDEDGVQYSAEEINENKTLIQQTLDSFGVKIKKITATIGPTVTLYEIEPEMGVKVAKIKSLEDDIAISLKAMSIRLIVPMPGRGTIGIEIPNRTRRTVSMHSVVKSKKFQESKAALPVVIGKTIQNETFVFDLADMPHMIVAGATGQGKSVGLNAIIASLLYKKHPAELKFVMVDPKKVELSLYSKLENHYLAKMESEDDAILTDTQKVVYTLNSLCVEMEERYKLLRMAGVKRIDAYNQKFLERKLHPKYGHRYLPYLVVVIDEFADMIMTAGKEVETPIVRLGQLARAIGIHLIIATQRPDAKVITGLISANCPARMAFKVTNRINSQIILGGTGAEKLTGRGDMLMQINGAETRLQCAFLDTPEIERIIDFISRQRGYSSAYMLPDYVPEDGGAGEPKEDIGDLDSMFEEVARFVVTNQQGSTSFIQRRFKIGYNRAGRIMDQLEAYGIVGKSEGSKPREVLISDSASLEKLLGDIFIENI